MQKRARVCWLPALLIGLAILLFNAFACRRDSQVGAQAATLKLGLGEFTKVADTKFLSAPAVVTDYDGGVLAELSRKTSKEGQVRNYLFFNLDDLGHQWLLPHSNFLFVTRQDLPFGATEAREEKEKVVAAAKPAPFTRALYYELVKANTNDNKVLDAYDRKTIALSEISGGNYVELINEIDDISYKQMHGADELLVIYRQADKHFAAKISLSQRQVTATKELLPIPKIQQPLS